MKVVKRMLAATSAIVMAVTMLSSVAVVQAAEGDPKITLKLTETAEDTYDLAVNVDLTDCAAGNRVFGIQTEFQNLGNLDTSKLLDKSLNEVTWTEEYTNIGFGPGLFASMASVNVVSTNNTTIKYTMADTSGNGQIVPMAWDVVTFKNLKIKDGVETDDITIAPALFLIGVGNSAADRQNITMDVADINTVVIPGNKPDVPPEPDKPEIPAATGATATGDQLLNLKPSDIGLEGDEWTTEDPAYADEKAVVSLANVKKDDAITGFTWEIKATDAEGSALEQTTKYFPIAGGVEASEISVGLVVGYDTTEWQSVEIVGVTAE